jgi:hypothetical protein
MSFALDYDWERGRRDLIAGLTVAAIALPQGMAYALIAGVDPKFGLYSVIVVTAIASIFGSSAHLINGPTSAISLLIFSALAFLDPENRTDLYEALFLLGVLVGAIQILIAVFKLGDLTRYVSESVIWLHGGSLLPARYRPDRQCARLTRQRHGRYAGSAPTLVDAIPWRSCQHQSAVHQRRRRRARRRPAQAGDAL